jgi:hypothetical protein
MNTMNRFEQWALAVGLALTVGCGDDGSDGEDGGGQTTEPGEIDTGLPEETQLQDVSTQEYANACESLRQSVSERLGPDRAVRGVCEVYSGAFVDDPAQCRSGADTCVTSVNAGNGPAGITRQSLDFTAFECGDAGDLQGCTVTVGELETCLDDRMTAIEQLLEGNDCDNAASVNLLTATSLLDVGSMLPPSCAGVQDECPSLAPLVGPVATQ